MQHSEWTLFLRTPAFPALRNGFIAEIQHDSTEFVRITYLNHSDRALLHREQKLDYPSFIDQIVEIGRQRNVGLCQIGIHLLQRP